MVEIGANAAQQVRELRDHYDTKGRPEAAVNLAIAIEQAIRRIGLDPAQSIAAPRPYPTLAQRGRLWIKEGRYWFRYSLTAPPVILAIFYDQADIRRRSK